MKKRKRNIVWAVGIVLLVTVVILRSYLGSKQQSRSAEIAQSPENQPGSQSQVVKTREGERKTLSLEESDGGNEFAESVQSVDAQKRVYVEDQLSASVKALLGLDEAKHNYNSLKTAIGRLSKDLSADDVAALRKMLTWPNDRFPEGMRPIEINAVKNDVLDRLLLQNELPEGLGLQIVEMASDFGNDPVWCDYCVQFMTPYYERAAGEVDLTTENTEEAGIQLSVSSSAERSEDNLRTQIVTKGNGSPGGEKSELEMVHDAMFQALDERDGTLAGTALIGLENLSRTHDEFDRDLIVSKAIEIASDESAHMESRLTALRLASQVGMEHGAGSREKTEAGEVTANQPSPGGDGGQEERRERNDDQIAELAEAARVLAQTGETVLLRSAAIETLGEIGSPNDRELLESYLSDANKQIADAAAMALAKMDHRTQ
jgi:hypothetical protein